MKLEIVCQTTNDASLVYDNLVNIGMSATKSITVTKTTVNVSTSKLQLSDEKLLINEIKQFLRDKEINHKIRISK